jgi:hypothetical protein
MGVAFFQIFCELFYISLSSFNIFFGVWNQTGVIVPGYLIKYPVFKNCLFPGHEKERAGKTRSNLKSSRRDY